jgi:hypothetical protein
MTYLPKVKHAGDLPPESLGFHPSGEGFVDEVEMIEHVSHSFLKDLSILPGVVF